MLGLFMVLVAGCKPDLGQPTSLVAERRILAIKSEPPETRPGQGATFSALVVSPMGTEAAPALAWALCLTPKPLDENNVVAAACLGEEGVMGVGNGPSVSAATPSNACQLFGPDPPPQEPGKPPLRPRDPDVSGGFYQPLRLRDSELTGFALQRITCNLASAGAEVAIEFGKRYRANQNPKLLPLAAVSGGQPAPAATVKAGQAVDFVASWAADTVETFPVYDIVTQTLVDHRESMRVSWFASDGRFAHERTGREEGDPATDTSNGWTAPSTAGTVHLWLVLRDSRGGVDFAGYDVQVTP
jgi:hypothetical protein